MLQLLFLLLIGTPPQDHCEDLGWYGDGICDADCPLPDPDCETEADTGDVPEETSDWCEEQGWYNDGVCDSDCPEPDPDC